MSRYSRLDEIVTAAQYWLIGAVSGILLLVAGLPKSDGYQTVLTIATVLVVNGLFIGAKVLPLRPLTRQRGQRPQQSKEDPYCLDSDET